MTTDNTAPNDAENVPHEMPPWCPRCGGSGKGPDWRGRFAAMCLYCRGTGRSK